MLAVLLLTPLLQACPKRQEIEAEIWINSGIPAQHCTPEVAKRGIYRRLNDDACREKGKPPGCAEFISYCTPEVTNYIAFNKDKLRELLDEAFGKPDATQQNSMDSGN